MELVLQLLPVCQLYEALGARHENFLMFDRKGVIT